MTKTILLGLLYQVVAAVGFSLIGRVTGIKDDVFKTLLVLTTAGVASVTIIAFYQLSGYAQVSTMRPVDWLSLAGGSLLLLVLGEYLYISGLSAAKGNLTPIALTALAYPAVALLLDWARQRYDQVTPGSALSPFTIPNLIGIVLVIAGFILLIVKK